MLFALVGPEFEENLSLRYLQGALERAGHEAKIVAFEKPSDVERAAREICTIKPEVAGFSMVFTRRADEYCALIARCRELGFKGLTLAGGTFAAFHAEQLLAEYPAIDAVALGEGEAIVCEIANSLADLRSVRGLVIREGTSLLRTEPAVLEENLDAYAWPTHRRPFDEFLGLPIVNMLSSRGCHYSCGFCSISAWHRLCGGSRYRQRSVGDVAAEMACMYRQGVRLFNFHDDNFLSADRHANTERVTALRQQLRAQGVGKIAFQIKARPDAIDEELFALLRNMGLFRVFLGIEAGTEESLRNLGRGQKLEDNIRALSILNGLDLHVAFNLLVLNPDSTFEDFEGNVDFLRNHCENPMNFCRTEIYTGTPLERKLQRENRLLGNYFGLNYRMKNSRCERAFRLFSAAFFERNFGVAPVHYLSAQVDYEHQLRMDFFGTTPAVRSEAKGYVRAVNENTVHYLDAIIAHVKTCDDDAEFMNQIASDVARDDRELAIRGQQALAIIRDLTAPANERTRLGRTVAAVAASVAMALAAACTRDTQPAEAAPPPPQNPDTGAPPDPTQMNEMAPVPPRDAAPTTTRTSPTTTTTTRVPTMPMEAAPYWPPTTFHTEKAPLPHTTHPAEATPRPPTYYPNEAAPMPPQPTEMAPPPPPPDPKK
jgi:radical SAM superfamily enzyme YgiQ (UPF0313 family)